MAGLSIGQVGGATGTKVETIRYYERIGLLPKPDRTNGNYRSYASEHVHRLAFIRRARELGFSIEDVRELLDLAGHRESPARESTKSPRGTWRRSKERSRRSNSFAASSATPLRLVPVGALPTVASSRRYQLIDSREEKRARRQARA